MGFKKKVSFFNRSLLKDWLTVLSPISVLVTCISIAISIPDEYKFSTFMIILFVFASIYVYLWVRANLLVERKLTINNSTVTIKVGDVFEESGLKVVAFNEYFDTQVDNKIISETTLNGIYLKTKIQDIEALDRSIEQDEHLNSDGIKVGFNETRSQGKKERYKLGTIFCHDDYLLTAFSKFDRENRAYLHMNDYINFLLNFWNEVDIVYNGKSIVIPLLGSGLTRFKNYEMITDQELLELLIWSFKVSKIKFTYPSMVSIIIHESKKDKVNFYKIKEQTNGL
ncbi:macro domain-containing protein [Cytobacillus oceanisediminis]|uniref:macro domain-containing protein n=1 Tax=Cytobacillus oceanisediminis TaxID=665099 RepID=UPI0011A9596C|nr:macro domain-containing protein [Cytobacillus oceanisediminis]